MKIFIEEMHCDIWATVKKNGPFIPTRLVDGVVKNKPKEFWTKEDKENV